MACAALAVGAEAADTAQSVAYLQLWQMVRGTEGNGLGQAITMSARVAGAWKCN